MGTPVYTEEDNVSIDALRVYGFSWDEIATILGRPGKASCIRQRAKVAGLSCLASDAAHRQQRESDRAERENQRDAWGQLPLPAFHPLSWNPIAGLVTA